MKSLTLKSAYLDALRERVLVFDGAMGTNIQRQHLSAEDFGGKSLEGCNDNLVLTRPDVIQGIHESFLAVGCDVVETCTFQSTPHRLREWGIEPRTHELNVNAARLARAACDKYAKPGTPKFVAGSIGPTGMLPSSSDPVLSRITFGALEDTYYAQAKGLIEGGVDVLLVETAQDILEVKAAIAGFERLFKDLGLRVPIQAQVTLDTSGRMLLGTDVASALVTLESLRIDVIGLNCSTGPEHMREPVRYLTSHATLPISCIPNAGLPLNTGTGDAVYPLEPAPMAEMLGEFVSEFGVRIVGGCCGTTPEHLAAIVDEVRKSEIGNGKWDPNSGPFPISHFPFPPSVSSAMRAITLRQEPPPLLIGERVNSQGSRKVKRLLLADDYDGILDVAKDQVDSGAHVLDVCVALTERADEAEQMAKIVKLLSMSVEAPIMIDSTEASVIDMALEHVPGRAIINSINMENGRERIDKVVPLAKKHGAALVALTIDQVGMAKTRERKLEVARAIHDIVVGEYGLAPDDLIFDDLTFTLATGDAEWINSAIETIEGIKAIKRELPGVFTSLGVSNVSFGLAPDARAVLNSVFLHHCVEAGLDMAIVNPAHVTPYAEIPNAERTLADDLIFNRRPDALQRFIEHYERREPRTDGGGAADREQLDPTTGMTPAEKVHWMVVHRKKDGIEDALDAAGVRESPVRVLNEVLLPAMKEVGDKFGAGELILPFVLQSAEVMKKAVKHLEQFLERAEGFTKGKVVLATVYGDVHDIGKSLVNTILSNNGYTVYDLGKQVPVNTIIEKAVEVNADAIGLSALLVSTSKQMPLCVQELDKRKLRFPVLIGGAAINRRFGRRAMFVEGERPYDSGVFYCKDAFEGLETMDRLQNAELRSAFVARLIEDARKDVFLRTTVGKDIAVGDDAGVRSAVSTDHPIPTAPFFGTRTINDIPLDELFQVLDLDELYRLQWGGRGSGPEYEKMVREVFEPTLARLKTAAKREGWLQPRATYGFFPVLSSANNLIVFDPDVYSKDGTLRELAQFHFPRQEGRERLCIADYFRSRESGDVDVVGFQIVTVGDEASRRFERLQTAGEYSEAYFAHGLAVETAEAVAEWMHRRIRHELAVPPGRGKRYSWGYGACPDLEDHATLFKILPAERELGMVLTSAYQLIPEQSTAAIIVHHPEAKYYAVRTANPVAAEAVA